MVNNDKSSVGGMHNCFKILFMAVRKAGEILIEFLNTVQAPVCEHATCQA